MSSEERQTRLEEYLQRVEFASLEELAQHVDISVSTVRRDLTALEEAGAVRRTHGGARIAQPKGDEFVFRMRDTRQREEKEAIGRCCAELVHNDQSIIVDAGTTVYHVACHLGAKRPHLVTNSLPVANLFSSASLVEVVVSGGVLYPRLGVLVGPLAVNAFSDMHADVAIIGGSGITVEGLYNSHALLIDIQRAMIAAARKVILCLDHTKFGRKSMSFVCGLENIDCVVTDGLAPEEEVGLLRAKGLEVILAESVQT
jgi:DeoR family transcriptional regulator, fructose operon transcriptional repressor